MEKMKMQTGDIANENFRKLAELFPNAVTETIDENGEVVRAIDKDILMQEISTRVVEGNEERYQFTWPDKRKAVRLASTPVAAALRPCREESVDFDTTENLYIEGDNLDVLKLLRETYLGKVKMIYIDPPYNTGNDFVYEDDFSEDADEFLFRDNQYDAQGNRLVQNTESNGRFHTDWLNMIYPRLKIAKDLLSEDGVIFISIDDNEVANLRKVCDEVFGEGNFIATLIWQQRKGGGNDSRFVAVDHEYILIYTKDSNKLSTQWRISQSEEYLKRYKEQDPDGRRYYWDTLTRNGLQNPIVISIKTPTGETITIKSQWSENRVSSGIKDGTIRFVKTDNGYKLHRKVFMKAGQVLRSLLTEYGNNRTAGLELATLFNEVLFSYAKPIGLLNILMQLCTKRNEIVLDFFSGSATTAHAVMQLNAEDGGNRKFIMVQLPEACESGSEAAKAGYKNICEIGKERIRRAGKKIKDEAGLTAGNLDIGFRVLKLDSSNMEDVYYNPTDTKQDDLLNLISNIKPDRTPEDLLFQVMLELGVTLSSTIEECEISGKKVFKVAGNFLIACFDENVTDDVVKAIAKEQPTYAVLRDSSFANDSVAANFEQIFATYSPDTVRRVL